MHRTFLLGLGLTFLGFIVVLIGVAMSAGDSGSASAGGVIFIGPIPIVFGTGPAGTELALGSVFIAVVMVAIFVLMGRRGA